jgi:hypothetical protein
LVQVLVPGKVSFYSFLTPSKNPPEQKGLLFFSDMKNTLLPEELQQLRINTPLSVCAVQDFEVIMVLSSSEKTAAGVSSSYIVTVNLKVLVNNMLPNNVLYY